MNNDILLRLGLILLALGVLLNSFANKSQDKQIKELKQQIIKLTAKGQE